MNTPAERDPRTDPRPGDVLKIWHGAASCKVTGRQEHADDFLIVEITYETGLRRDQWEECFKDAEVTHRAD